MLYKAKKIVDKENKLNEKYLNPDAMNNRMLEISESITKGYRELLLEILAKNIIAWENSKDKSESLLPEVYLDNLAIYEHIKGEEFDLLEAEKKYYN